MRQDSASSGMRRPFASLPTSVSKTWLPTLLFGVRLWKCGSIEVTSAPSAMLKSAARTGSAPNSTAAITQTNVLMSRTPSAPTCRDEHTKRRRGSDVDSFASAHLCSMHHGGQRLPSIRTLVGFPTVSRDSNLDLIDFVRGLLRELDADVRLTFDDERRKANLFATLGPRTSGGLVLSGHTDVVPVDGQAWDTDPFSLTEIDGRLYGRGTSDMKSFLAIALALLPRYAARPRTAAASRALVRRRSRLHRRGASHRGSRARRHQARRLHRGRADADVAGDRAQGQAQLSLQRARRSRPIRRMRRRR